MLLGEFSVFAFSSLLQNALITVDTQLVITVVNLVDVLLQLAGNVIKYSCSSNLNLYRKWAFSISLYPFFPLFLHPQSNLHTEVQKYQNKEWMDSHPL